MSMRAPVPRLRRLACLVGIVFALQPGPGAPAATPARDVAPTETAVVAANRVISRESPARAPFMPLIARVLVNTVSKGDIAILRDADGLVLVPAAQLAQWGLTFPNANPVTVDGERYVVVSAIDGLDARFDEKQVTLELRVAAGALPGTTLNLGPQHRGEVTYPSDTSVFLNYGVNANGDDSFGQRRYQFATELGARWGSWLFYNTTSEEWGEASSHRFTRLLTNAQYDDRVNLRRLTVGDFFTPTFDLAASVPLGGVSFTKMYSMDPYFIQYPTAAFQTEVAFPSTVQVRVDGNLIAQRQVPPGPIDITNIAGVTGAQNVSVVIRDPFGREQVLQRPFFFATNVGLAEGLHEYSYNLGFLRRNYGVDSNDYGPLAAAAFHRYAFTDQLTLGLRGQATENLYNIGPFGTYQSPLGIVGGGVSVGGQDGHSGVAAVAAYSYTGGNVSLNLGAQYLAREYAQLSDLNAGVHARTNQYASGSVYLAALGSLTATYTALTSYDGPQTKVWTVAYTRPMLDSKGLFAVNYIQSVQPRTSGNWLLSFRYFFDAVTSVVAAVGGVGGRGTQALSLEKSIPQGEGIGYVFTGGHASGDGTDGAFGRAFVQVNATHATFGADYSRASTPQAGPGLSQVFLAGSLGYVGGSAFASRPVDDSFAVVRVPGLRDVPVYSNGWLAGRTNADGQVIATNITSYYDNFITFGSSELPLEYVFSKSAVVISPPSRSGTLVAFEVKKNRAIYGTLVRMRGNTASPLEFREITVTREAQVTHSFTGRRGEFYLEGVEPGTYELRPDGEPDCVARVIVPEVGEAMLDIGTAICSTTPR